MTYEIANITCCKSVLPDEKYIFVPFFKLNYCTKRADTLYFQLLRFFMDISFFLNTNYLVLKIINDNQDEKQITKLTQNRIAELSGVGKNKINEVIKALTVNGFIAPSGKRGSYTLTPSGVFAISAVERIIVEREPDKLRFIDLFAGIGGIRKAFEGEDAKCVFSCEWDRSAQKTYEANYGEVPFGDITKIDEKDIPPHDVLLAGFPCQPFSMIGKREGFEDERGRGTLFFDILRIIRYHHPKMLLLENVPGILTIQDGETFKVILSLLNNEGYDVSWKVLDSVFFGLPQSRKRVIIVGFAKELQIKNFDIPETNNAELKLACDIIEDNPKGYSISKHLQESYLFKKKDGHPQIIDKNSRVICKTLCASYHKIQRITGTFVRGGETGVRLLSENECKRLMGYPDDFKFPVSRTQMYHQLGNSVCVPVMKTVADAMKDAFFTKNKVR